MKNVRALIAEDEPLLALSLQQSLQRLWPELKMEAIAENGMAAVEQTLALRPDVLFLDIKMPGKSGLDAAQELAEDWPDETPFPLLVFVTAYDDYAVQAFEQAAVDYVLKPVADNRLTKTVERLQSRLQMRLEPKAELDRIIEQLRGMTPASPTQSPLPTQPPQRLTLIRAAVGNQIRMIPVADVHYFEATDKYVNVVTADSESLIRTSLKELLPQLDPQQFWQVHRGTVVNMHYVEAAVRDDSGKLSLRLKGNSRQLAVSRVFAPLFKQM